VTCLIPDELSYRGYGVIGFPHTTGDVIIVRLRSGRYVRGVLTSITHEGRNVRSVSIGKTHVAWAQVEVSRTVKPW
jgi:hypothetical protein